MTADCAVRFWTHDSLKGSLHPHPLPVGEEELQGISTSPPDHGFVDTSIVVARMAPSSAISMAWTWMSLPTLNSSRRTS